MDLLPKIVYPDIVNYLLFAPSPYTAEQLKCFKAMDSYNYFLSGFVKEVGAKVFSNICLLVGRHSHSQKLSEKHPTAWVITEIGGEVLSTHCNCMAGLGEACSHIGAILFYCRDATEKKDSGKEAYWVLPSNCKDITASKMHSVLHTNSDMPSVSFLKSICYPESYRFSVEATKGGST